MGNSDGTPNTDSLSLESSAPLWSRILTEVSQDMPIAKFVRPDGLVDVEVDAFSGLLPGPGTVKTVKEMFIEGTEPTRKDNLHVQVDIDEATGRLWQEGCTGPKSTRLYLDFSQAEERFPAWQPYTQGWADRAARGAGVRGGPKKTRTMYFYNLSFHPYGATWGGRFKPTEVCQPIVVCPPEPASPEPSDAVPCIPTNPTPKPPATGGPPETGGPPPTKPSKPPKPTNGPLPTLAASLDGAAAVEPLAFFPLLVPFAGVAIASRFKPKRPARPKRRR